MDDNDYAFESLANIDISDIDFEDGSVGQSHQVVNCPEKKSKEVPQKHTSSAPGKFDSNDLSRGQVLQVAAMS